MLVTVATFALSVAVVLLHYEVFLLLANRLERLRLRNRPRMLVLIFCLLVVHMVEICLFGATAWALAQVEGLGTLQGPYPTGLLDYVYMSAVTFSTLGFGDLFPVGPLRFLYGAEGLVGFALITWSASLIFIEMQRHWRPGP